MQQHFIAAALITIAGGCLYLLWNRRFEEGILGHFALGSATAFCCIGVYQILLQGQALLCHPVIGGLLYSIAMFLVWYDIKLYRAGERRQLPRLNQQRDAMRQP